MADTTQTKLQIILELIKQGDGAVQANAEVQKLAAELAKLVDELTATNQAAKDAASAVQQEAVATQKQTQEVAKSTETVKVAKQERDKLVKTLEGEEAKLISNAQAQARLALVQGDNTTALAALHAALGQLTEGSTAYYALLTQITQVQQRANEEAAKASQATSFALPVVKDYTGAKEKEGKAGDGAADSLKRQALQLIGYTSAAALAAKLIHESIQAWTEQELAIQKVEGTLRAGAQFSEEYSQALQDMASAFQDSTNIADEKILDVEGRLISFGAKRDVIQGMTADVLDLSAGLGGDLAGAAQLVGAAISGEFAPATRMLKIDLDDTMTREEKLEKVLATIRERFGGLAEATKEQTGGLKGFKTASGEALEVLGKLILTGIEPYVRATTEAIKATTEFVGWLSKMGQSESGAESTDALVKAIDLRTSLIRQIKEAVDAGTLENEQAEKLVAHLGKVSTNLDEIIRKNKEVQNSFLTGAPLPVSTDNSNKRDPATAKRQMDDLAFDHAMERINNSMQDRPGRNEANPAFRFAKDMLKDQAEWEKITLEQQRDSGLISESEFKAQRDKMQQTYSLSLGQMAIEGKKANDDLMRMQWSGYQLEQRQIEEHFSAMRESIYAYYQFKTDQAGNDQQQVEAVYKQATATMSALAREQSLAEFDARLHSIGLSAQGVAQSIAGGLTSAITGFIQGTKNAGAAAKEFLANLLQMFSQAIMQALIFRAVMALIGFAVGGSVSSAQATPSSSVTVPTVGGVPTMQSTGGITYAASGIMSLDRAAYLPKWNVVAGEAGREMLAVFAQPQTMNLNGLPAITGNIKGNRMALINQNDLAAMLSVRNPASYAASGIISGMGGLSSQLSTVTQTSSNATPARAVVEIGLAPGLIASVKNDAAQQAVQVVVRDLNQDSAIASGVKKLAS